MPNTRLLWVIIFVIALFLRMYGLGLNPIGLNHDDELHEIINSKSLALAGVHAPGRVAGILTQNDECPGNCVYGELGSYLFIPWMWIFPLDIFWSKLPFAIASALLVLFTGKLFKNLTGNTMVGLIVASTMAINPWSIHFGRTAYFTTFSYLFYIIGAYLFTRNSSYKSNLLLGSIFSFIGFFFYFGTKPIFPLIFIWGLIYNLRKFKTAFLPFTIVICIIFSILLGIYFFILSSSYAGRRITEIGPGTAETIESQVDKERQISLEIPFLRDLFINKYTVESSIIIQKYLGFFSPVFLFVKSEGSTSNYYISNHGYYYLIDSMFLIVGFIAVSTNIVGGLFVLILLLIAVIPAGLKITGDTIYSLRAGLAYPVMSGIIGWGIYYCYSKLNSTNRKHFIGKTIIIFIAFIYFLSFMNFWVMYWYRSPIERSEGWHFYKRVAIDYITRMQKISDKKITVVTAQPDATFNTYIFYSGLYNNKDTIIQINNNLSQKKYSFNNVEFVNNCNSINNEDMKNNIIFIERGVEFCNQTNSLLAFEIANPKDSGGLYKIINETLCKNYQKEKYPYPRSINDFNIEKMDTGLFCKLWITNPNSAKQY